MEDALVASLELEEELSQRVEGHLLKVELAPPAQPHLVGVRVGVRVRVRVRVGVGVRVRSAQPHRAPLGVVLDRKDDVLVGVAVDL